MAKAKKPHYAGGFLLLPTAMLCSQRFRALSPSAVKLLVDIGSQFNGKNNGDLSAAWKLMHPRGWNSEATLNRAKKELIAQGFIAETRKGRLPNLCSLYGVTWQPLNPSAKLDVGPAGFPVGAWAEPLPASPAKNKTPTTETVVAMRRIATEMKADPMPVATEMKAMRAERAVL